MCVQDLDGMYDGLQADFWDVHQEVAEKFSLER